jgi:GrpB-like predicted nucleotidyltransferase (UPF0157 family)
VIVVDYDADWPRTFEQLRARISTRLTDVAVRIEHVGSTSVPGLAAKPIIDLTVVVAARGDVPAAIDRLASLGYRHQGSLGIEDREAFAHPGDLPRHNLYVCPEGTIGQINQVAVRDYLRAQPEASRRYGELKKRLAVEFPTDIESYVFGKTDFILDVLRRAGLSAEQLASIERVNRRPDRLPLNLPPLAEEAAGRAFGAERGQPDDRVGPFLD